MSCETGEQSTCCTGGIGAHVNASDDNKPNPNPNRQWALAVTQNNDVTVLKLFNQCGTCTQTYTFQRVGAECRFPLVAGIVDAICNDNTRFHGAHEIRPTVIVEKSGWESPSGARIVAGINGVVLDIPYTAWRNWDASVDVCKYMVDCLQGRQTGMPVESARQNTPL
jgi:hypothetical protein